MSDHMRDTRKGHIKEEIEGVCVCIAGEVYRSVCVKKELWRLWENDLKKKMNVPGG